MRLAIGDIHGCFKTFRKLIEDIIHLGKSDTLYLVGDYIDRGPESMEVVDYIIQLKDEGYNLQPVRGNHEEMLIDAYKDQSPENFRLWMMNGAESTLKSYDIASYSVMGSASLNELPEHHTSFFKKLPYYIMLDDFIIVHAGINFEAEEPFSDYRSMVWCRDCENDLIKSKNRIVIHGHTPTPLEELNFHDNMDKEKQINLDTGCVYKTFTGMGNLTAMDLDSFQIYNAENIDF
ncbi:MAG: metallophosphoesterase family protein [Bacteroidales bacterium]